MAILIEYFFISYILQTILAYLKWYLSCKFYNVIIYLRIAGFPRVGIFIKLKTESLLLFWIFRPEAPALFLLSWRWTEVPVVARVTRNILLILGLPKPRIFFGNDAEILKWECEMVSLPKVGITITASLMNTIRTGLRNSCCCCIHKHFFRTHNNPWALYWGHQTPLIPVVYVSWQWLKKVTWI